MDKPTGKTHKLVTFADLLKLTPAEMKRLVPDLLAWHATHIQVVELLECTPEEMNARIEWADDGENTLTGIDVNCGEHGVFDLLRPETWPTEAAQRATQATKEGWV